MSVEYGIELVRWDEFRRLWAEHGDPEFYYEAEDSRPEWILPRRPDPSWVSSWKAGIHFSETWKAIRGELDEAARRRFEKFLSRFCLSDELERWNMPKDLGEEIGDHIFFGTLAPETARHYLRLWDGLDMDELRPAFESHAPRLPPYMTTFDDFERYPGMWANLLREAVEKDAGIVVTLA